MRKKEETTNIMETFLSGQLEKHVSGLDKYFEGNKEEITDDFIATINNLCALAKEQQASGVKAPICYLHIGFLRSSLLTGTYDFRVALHSNLLWLDKTETSVYWVPGFVFKYVSRDISDMVEFARRERTPISKFAVDELKYRYAQAYIGQVQSIATKIMPGAIEKSDFTQLELEDKYTAVFGGHMESGTIIFPLGTGGGDEKGVQAV